MREIFLLNCFFHDLQEQRILNTSKDLVRRQTSWMLWRASEIISKQCLSGPKYNHQCVMYPTLCIYIFWKFIYSWRGFVRANAPTLCVTYAQILHAFMLFLYIYFQTRSCDGQCTPCQNSSWFCLTQGKLYTQQELWGFMLDVVWKRADCVLKWAA